MSMEEVRWKAVFPGIETSSSILQCKFAPFSAKLVHPSVNLPATRLGAGKGRKNGTVKALMPSCYTGRQEGIRANLQGIDGRSQMQSAFPCLVHANAHD